MHIFDSLKSLISLVIVRFFSLILYIQFIGRKGRHSALSFYPLPFPFNGEMLRKTLVLDLDETLVHSGIAPQKRYNWKVSIINEGGKCDFYVMKRPFLEHFLRTVSVWYDIVFFTASAKEYASHVFDLLDEYLVNPSGRYYRKDCRLEAGVYYKDIENLYGIDMDHVVYIDNSLPNCLLYKDNAIPITSWFGDKNDTRLMDLIPILAALRFSSSIPKFLRSRLQR